MIELTKRAKRLWLNRAARVSLLAIGLCGLAFRAAPLLDLPGYEWAEAMSLVVGILGGLVGIQAAQLEVKAQDASVAQAFLSAFLCVMTPVLASLSLLIVISKLNSPCDPFIQFAFVPLLVLPTAALSTAVGIWAGLQASGRRNALWFYFGVLLGSFVWTAWPIVTGPQVYAFNHFLGHLPGPLYDESLRVSPALLWFRALTLLWAQAFLLLGRNTLLRGQGPARQSRSSHLLTAALFLVAAWGESLGPRFGFRMTHAHLVSELGAKAQSRHFELVYPKAFPEESVAQTLRDLEFRHMQLAHFLGTAPKEPIQVFLYSSVEQKQRLVGAARTQFAKPWLLELHLNPSPFPHPVLKHELAHVMAAPLGSGPFRVTTRWGLLPHMALIEGLAVAADDDSDTWNLHEWVVGMRKHNLMPDLPSLLSPQGFYLAAPGRAYTVVGSFLRYLREKYGQKAIQLLYAQGDFEKAFGTSVDSLVHEWEAYLSKLSIDEKALNEAFSRFRKESLFARNCAREVASLADEARRLLEHQPMRALDAWARCAQLQPNEPGFVLAQAQVLAHSKDYATARKLLQDRLSDNLSPATEADVKTLQATLAFHEGDLEATRNHLKRVLALQVSPAVERMAHVMLWAIEKPHLTRAVFEALESNDENVRESALDEALSLGPEEALVQYLTARRFHRKNKPKEAMDALTKALGGPLPESIEAEARRLLWEVEFRLGDCLSLRHRESLLEGAKRETAKLWSERCEFESTLRAVPLAPPPTFQ